MTVITSYMAMITSYMTVVSSHMTVVTSYMTVVTDKELSGYKGVDWMFLTRAPKHVVMCTDKQTNDWLNFNVVTVN